MKGYKNLYTGETIKNVVNGNVVGNPTINNGVVSSLSANDYITISQQISNTASFTIKLRVTTSSDVISDQGIFMPKGASTSDNNMINVWLYNGSFTVYLYRAANTSIGNISISNIQPNTTYDLLVTRNTNTNVYGFSATPIGGTTQSNTLSSSYNIYQATLPYTFGNARTIDRPFLGSIDFKECYINVNNSVVWNGTRAVTLPNIKLIKHKQSNTNVITHIANDVKLEANNNIPILKAGSVVYIPNGFEQDGTTRKFDRVVLENDVTSSSAITTTHYLFYRTSNPTVFQRVPLNKCHSGDTQPTPVGNDDMWYDTANNLLKRYDGSSTFNALGTCLPVGIYNGTTQQFEAIFNGFGCIGSTVFVLPDVSGLIPNGFNADGSFKITSFTTQTVLTNTYTGTATNDYYFQCSESFCGRISKTVAEYNPSENKSYWNNGGTWQQLYNIFDGTFRMESGKVTSVSQLPTVQPSTIPIYKAVDLN